MQKLLDKNNLVVILFFVSCLNIKAQSKSDLELIAAHSESTVYQKRHVTYLFKNSKSNIVKYNPLSLSLGGLMYVYQKVLSPQILSECPYELSCSNFSKAVINRYGIAKGVFLTADRLMRCNSTAARDITPFDFNDKHRIIDQPENYCFHP